MPTPTRRSRTHARAPLSRERILQAALNLADKAGVEELSMRRLAHTLRVEAMSLYKHVANKDDVLDGVVDLVLGEIEFPPPGTPWREGMRARALSARQAFLRHPWAAMLFESRISMSPVRLRYTNAVLGLLREDGFSLEAAYRAFLLVDSYLYGFIMQELSWPCDEEDIPAITEQMRSSMSADDFPHLSQVMGHFITTVASTGSTGVYDAQFAQGLELILDAMARLRASN